MYGKKEIVNIYNIKRINIAQYFLLEEWYRYSCTQTNTSVDK
jgi:hypothetical protein